MEAPRASIYIALIGKELQKVTDGMVAAGLHTGKTSLPPGAEHEQEYSENSFHYTSIGSK